MHARPLKGIGETKKLHGSRCPRKRRNDGKELVKPTIKGSGFEKKNLTKKPPARRAPKAKKEQGGGKDDLRHLRP